MADALAIDSSVFASTGGGGEVQTSSASVQSVNNRYSSGDVKKYIESLKRCELLTELEVKLLCDIVKEILVDESNVHMVSAPVIVCGDIHGQLFDLLKLFEVGGEIPNSRYVFMGDYVDRGYHGVECFSLLLCYKALYPDAITLLRGNHESRSLTQTYGFYDECMKKYGTHNVWKYFTDVFDHLLLAALIDNRVMCVHGGLSPHLNTIDQMRNLDRKQELPIDGALADMLWSDPEDITGWGISSRGAGFIFGGDVVEKFNEINHLDLIARSHQVVHEGYKFHFNSTPQSKYKEGSLVTVWSAPNYVYRMGNVASIMHLDDELNASFKIFDAATQDNRNTPRSLALEYFL